MHRVAPLCAHLELARAEMVEKAKSAGMGAGLLSGSLLTANMTFFALTMLLIFGLSAFVQQWIAALIVTLLWACATAVLALTGKQKLAQAGPPIPEEAIANVKADLENAKDEALQIKEA